MNVFRRTHASKLRIATVLLALSALTSCGDNARLPTEPGGNGGSTGIKPRLVQGDSIRLVASRPSVMPERCSDLPTIEYAMITDTVFACIPVEQYSAGIGQVTVSGVQQQVDPTLGTSSSVAVFSPVKIEFPESSLRKRTLLTPQLIPTSEQKVGPFEVQVELVSASNTKGNYSRKFDLRAPSEVSILEPAADALYGPGTIVFAKTAVENKLGVLEVRIRWSGAAEYSETIRLPNTPVQDTIKHALAIPSTAQNGKVTLEVQVMDSKGTLSPSTKRDIVVKQGVFAGFPPPVVTSVKTATTTLEDGAEITISARDESGVRAIGFALVQQATDSILSIQIDSTLAGDTVHTAALRLRFPDKFPYGTVQLIPFADDRGGNRGWYRLDGVRTASRDSADAAPVRLVAGKSIPITNATGFIAAAAHPSRQEIYFANDVRNRVEVFNVTSEEFVRNVRVGSNPSSMAFVPNADGTPGNRLIVANRGGVELSEITVNSTSETSGRILMPRLQVSDTTDNKDYVVGGRPHSVAVVCEPGTSCANHRVYLSNLPETGTQTSFSVLRTFLLGTPSTVDVVTPRHNLIGRLADPDANDQAYLILQKQEADGTWTTIREDSVRALGSTVFAAAPLFAVDPANPSYLYVAEPVGSQNLSKIPGKMNRLNTAGTSWDGKAVDGLDYLEGLNTNNAEIKGNADMSLLIIRNGAQAVIVDRDLNRIGAFDHSGRELSAITFLEGHTGTARTAEDGGMIAVAPRGEPYIDIYDTWNYQLQSRIPIRSPITGPLVFMRTATGSDEVVLIGRTDAGLSLVRMKISDILALD